MTFTTEQEIVDTDGSVTIKSSADDESNNTAMSHAPGTPPLSAALKDSDAARPEGEAPAVAGDGPNGDVLEDPALDLSLMKKKKKKKKVEIDDGEGGEAPAEGEDGGLDLSMKKKKKKKAKDTDDDEFAAKLKALDLEGKEDAGAAAEPAQEGDMDAGTGIWAHDDSRTIAYNPLLRRFFSSLAQKNPDHALSGTKSYKIPPPQCMREGNKKTIFANIAEICKRMKRTDEHVTAYLFAELGTSGSVDGSRRLVIKGRFQQKQIENVLRKYISECPLSASLILGALPFSNRTCSRIRDVQDVQVARHGAQQGREPPVLPHVQLVRLEAQCHGDQDWFLGPGRQEAEDAGVSHTRKGACSGHSFLSLWDAGGCGGLESRPYETTKVHVGGLTGPQNDRRTWDWGGIVRTRTGGARLCGLSSELWMRGTAALEQKEFGGDGPGSMRLESSRLEFNGLLGLVPA